ncbi:MAG: M14 metallopeptidase family protein [Acidobacteriota bacterium]
MASFLTSRSVRMLRTILIPALVCSGTLTAQSLLPVTTPLQSLGFSVGDDYQVANYSKMMAYWKTLDAESDRMMLVDIGATAEGRRQVMAIVSSPANLAKLDEYKSIARRLAHAEDLSEEQAAALARTGKAVVWIDGGLHASETVGSQQLIEMVYQMVSRTDAETMRLLDDVIQLYVPANPDGQELLADWYMRESDPLKRSLNQVPRLYQKYIGHDDNRDFFLSAMPETTNMNRQMFIEWFPQIVYNHHQTGPAGAVVFIPPFRDPFNYNLDPLIPLGIEMVGTAMHSRLVAEGKGGSAMRSGANYSTWWNGGLRTVSYFHNMIGILTEIIGSPTPIDIALVADKQLPQGDWPLPIKPQKWHYRQSIDYEITQNRAILDYASRYRETILMNIYRMGRNSIERGNHDTWTVTPKRIAALKAEAAKGTGNRMTPELYDTLLHDPKLRDPRGYIIPASQADFPTAVKFINTLVKTGISVQQATARFDIAGKAYPAGSFVVKSAQAFRPHVLDMFEPQDHPDDFRYPGGPPVPPYDIAGWTLAMQMGVQYDRIFEGFDGPFVTINAVASPPPAQISGTNPASSYCVGHETNDAFIVVNRLLKAGDEVFWMQADGAFCTPASPQAREVIARGATELGVAARAVATSPGGAAFKLKPLRIGLFDQYGGLAPSGWTRWILEQFEFPFEVVYPQTLDAGNLRQKFDVLLFTDGAFQTGGRGGGGAAGQQRTESIPTEFQGLTGRITAENTVPQLKTFVEAGGAVVTIGSATSLGSLLGVPMTDHLIKQAADGTTKALARDDFYVPGSLLRVKLDTSNPITQGMQPEALVFFDNSPVFDVPVNAKSVAAYEGPEFLASGWAWGQKYLAGGTAVAEAAVGEGKVFFFGPEVAFRAQPHGTFKLLFNSLMYGSAKAIMLP